MVKSWIITLEVLFMSKNNFPSKDQTKNTGLGNKPGQAGLDKSKTSHVPPTTGAPGAIQKDRTMGGNLGNQQQDKWKDRR